MQLTFPGIQMSSEMTCCTYCCGTVLCPVEMYTPVIPIGAVEILYKPAHCEPIHEDSFSECDNVTLAAHPKLNSHDVMQWL